MYIIAAPETDNQLMGYNLVGNTIYYISTYSTNVFLGYVDVTSGPDGEVFFLVAPRTSGDKFMILACQS